jgi:hypothetical protein
MYHHSRSSMAAIVSALIIPRASRARSNVSEQPTEWRSETVGR